MVKTPKWPRKNIDRLSGNIELLQQIQEVENKCETKLLQIKDRSLQEMISEAQTTHQNNAYSNDAICARTQYSNSKR